MFIVLVLPTKSQRNALHNIHSLAWSHILMGPQATAQRAHSLRRQWFQDIIQLVHREYGSVIHNKCETSNSYCRAITRVSMKPCEINSN